MRTSVRAVFAAAAASYGRGNPLLVLERPETEALIPPLAGSDVLDLGAGRGHYAAYARAKGARLAIGLDLTPEMVAGIVQCGVVGEAERLPLASGSIDVVVAALVLSFVPDRSRMFSEVARVLRPGGCLVLSDLHPVASQRGWRRTFAGAPGNRLVAEAAPPALAELGRDLQEAAFRIEVLAEPVIDERLEREFRRAGRTDYGALAGTPLLVVLRARKGGR